MIEPIELGVCGGYEYAGNGPTAIALPGAMLGGMPSVGFAIEGVRRNGWRVVQVWDERRDRAADATRWTNERLEAAASFAREPALVIAKSVTTRAAGLVADRGWPGVWLTPLLDDEESVEGLRRRRAPALLVGGTNDPTWDGPLARELSDDTLELAGADHGLARLEDLGAVAGAVAAFSRRLRA
ncbi:MAG: alpha/beta hydrolase [Gaiellaceae bacterium]